VDERAGAKEILGDSGQRFVRILRPSQSHEDTRTRRRNTRPQQPGTKATNGSKRFRDQRQVVIEEAAAQPRQQTGVIGQP
jgi:hypothetical protein